jgi:hypothetical protein
VRRAIQDAEAKEIRHDRRTALHDASNHHPVCGRCRRAGQLAFVTGDISTYAPSHCGQGIDGKNSARTYTRLKPIPVIAYAQGFLALSAGSGVNGEFSFA